MSHEDVTPLDQLVGVDALMGQLLTVEKPFEMGFKRNGYRGVLQGNHAGFCKKEPLKVGDYVEVTGVMEDETTLFCKKVEMPVNSWHETVERHDAQIPRLETSVEALWGVVTQLTQENEWIKDRLPGA